MNYLALTNHEDAMPLEDSDRRYACYKTRFETKAEMEAATGRDYWRNIYDAIDNHAGEILGWLCSIDLSDFNPNEAPAVNAYKATMIELSRSDDEINVKEIMEEGGRGISEEVVSTRHLGAALKDRFGRPLSTKRMSNILNMLGMHKTKKMRWDNSVVTFYVSDKSLTNDLLGASAKIKEIADKTVQEELANAFC